MMTSIGHKEDWLVLTAVKDLETGFRISKVGRSSGTRLPTYRCDDREIGKMAATASRMIGQDHIALFERSRLWILDLVLDGFLHGAKVNWNMRRVSHQTTIGIEHSTAVIEPLFDVGGHRCSLKDSELNNQWQTRILKSWNQSHVTMVTFPKTDKIDLSSSKRFFIKVSQANPTICSAMLMKRCEKMDKVVMSSCSLLLALCCCSSICMTMSPSSLSLAEQFGSIRIVLKTTGVVIRRLFYSKAVDCAHLFLSIMMAGPAIWSSAKKSSML